MNLDWLFVEYRFSIIFSIMDIIIVLFGYIVVVFVYEFIAAVIKEKIKQRSKKKYYIVNEDRINHTGE